MKYIFKNFNEIDEATGKKIPAPEFEIEEIKKDTKIQTKWGEVLITKGNYVATDKDGNQFGIAAPDLELLYKKAEGL